MALSLHSTDSVDGGFPLFLSQMNSQHNVIIIKVSINNSLRKQTCSNLHGNKMNTGKRKNTLGKQLNKYQLVLKRHLLIKTY